MFKRNDPARHRALRGVILRLAHLAAASEASNPDDPYTISRTVLIQTLEQTDGLPANEDLRGALRYLEAKGYVKVRWLRDGTGEFVSFRLEAAGIDLVEGTTEDPGVKFQRRREF